MKNIPYLLATASFFVLIGCSESKSTTPAVTATPVTAAPTQNTVNAQPQAAPVAQALNPPHGEPNHRCDIEVGKPLNSAPKTAPIPQAPVMPAPVFTPPPTGSVAAGTNPPHGQPGHDCGLPVGAPLK